MINRLYCVSITRRAAELINRRLNNTDIYSYVFSVQPTVMTDNISLMH